MKKLGILTLMCASMVSSATFGVTFELKKFRLAYFVLYETLYKIEGIPTTEFKNVKITKEGTTVFKFEYNGRSYGAYYIAPNALYIDMPEGLNDRYIARPRINYLILSTFEY